VGGYTPIIIFVGVYQGIPSTTLEGRLGGVAAVPPTSPDSASFTAFHAKTAVAMACTPCYPCTPRTPGIFLFLGYYPVLSRTIPYYPALSRVLSRIIPHYPEYYPVLSDVATACSSAPRIIPYYPTWRAPRIIPHYPAISDQYLGIILAALYVGAGDEMGDGAPPRPLDYYSGCKGVFPKKKNIINRPPNNGSAAE